MTTTGRRVERSGPAISAVLAQFSAEEAGQFQEEFRKAAQQAAERLDVAPLDEVLDRWWGIAAMHQQPLTTQEEQQLARARAGDFTGLSTRDADGTWRRL